MGLIETLKLHFPEDRLKYKLIERHAYSCDASFYQLIPEAIVFPHSINEIQLLFKIARTLQSHITFRTGGTSLSGQSITDGILVDLSRYWNQADVLEEGTLLKAQPGITGALLNHKLRSFGRKIGPDPASIHAAMFGGILSNNSSGMCCGVHHNAYHTLHSITFVLPDGSSYNTASPNEHDRFAKESNLVFQHLKDLRDRVRTNTLLVERIRSKYKIKNTVGYGLNAFLDYDHPLDILAHLLIGAEGTLAFIASATIQTIPEKPFKKTGLLFFDNPKAACDAISALKATQVEALEFMDRSALRSIEKMPDAPDFISTLPDTAACILCEYQSTSKATLDLLFDQAYNVIQSLELIHEATFTTDSVTQASYWKLRKGMYPSVAAVRKKGTSVMLEDVALPVEHLGDAIVSLQKLFKKFNYDDAIVFGHAKEGNLHFLVSQSINSTEQLNHFKAFNDALAELIIGKYQGSLKAEHGTGRQIAPYVSAEWGEDAYEIMASLKKCIDPDGILNPGVIINSDPECHIKHMKSLPIIEEEVDTCVECGYCEPSCPSRNYTLSPRQRIIVRRSLKRLKDHNQLKEYQQLLTDYKFHGMDTCAVDGMCANDCPVDINTGELVKRLRNENHHELSKWLAKQIATHFKFMEYSLKFILKFGSGINRIFGSQTMHILTKGLHTIVPKIPVWPKFLKGPMTIRHQNHTISQAVYIPACMSRMMGADMELKLSIVDIMKRLTQKASINLFIPTDSIGTCCGQAFSSKGFHNAYQLAVTSFLDKVWTWTQEGKLPVVLDITSCTQSFKAARPFLSPTDQIRFDQLTILDSIEFASDYLLSHLTIKEKKSFVVLHPVCSVHKLKLNAKLQKIASFAAVETTIPITASCCGMAGDRGFYYPGLIHAATASEAAEVNEISTSNVYSSSKPCEMSLSEATGRNYRSILYLLDEVTIQKKSPE